MISNMNEINLLDHFEKEDAYYTSCKCWDSYHRYKLQVNINIATPINKEMILSKQKRYEWMFLWVDNTEHCSYPRRLVKRGKPCISLSINFEPLLFCFIPVSVYTQYTEFIYQNMKQKHCVCIIGIAISPQKLA